MEGNGPRRADDCGRLLGGADGGARVVLVRVPVGARRRRRSVPLARHALRARAACLAGTARAACRMTIVSCCHSAGRVRALLARVSHALPSAVGGPQDALLRLCGALFGAVL